MFSIPMVTNSYWHFQSVFLFIICSRRYLNGLTLTFYFSLSQPELLRIFVISCTIRPNEHTVSNICISPSFFLSRFLFLILKVRRLIRKLKAESRKKNVTKLKYFFDIWTEERKIWMLAEQCFLLNVFPIDFFPSCL